MERHSRALRSYVPEPYPGSVVLFSARDREGSADASEWSALCAGSFRPHVVPGTHETMILSPHAAELARLLGPALAPT